MRRYLWPGYETQLLAELQRQQNSAQFCDTLLQTEGISVPTHRCVLAALSPYLSQKLSASPSPPSGQKHQLQLQTVKAQTLLKLVGLLYSGELEVKGGTEQNDVLAVARQFGIANLVEGQEDGGMKEAGLQERSRRSCRENGFHAEESRGSNDSRKMQDAQVQAEVAGRMDTASPAEKRSCISTGTQTVKAGEKSVGSSVSLSSQAAPPAPESAPSVAQSLDFTAMLQPQSIALDKQCCSTSCPVIPTMPTGASSNGESMLNQSSGSLKNPTSTPVFSSDTLTPPISLNDDSGSSRPQEDSTYQQSPELGGSIQALAAEERTELESRERSGKMADGRGGRGWPSQANSDEMPGEERGKSTEERQVGMKSLARMKQLQQMMETTQISIKVKLRRRTKGELWEVVNVQDTEETLSVLASLKQDGSSHKRPDKDPSNVPPPPPSTAQPGPIQRPDCHILQPTTTSLLISPPHPNTSSDSQTLSSDCFTPNQNNGFEVAPFLQLQGSEEESDEQIEKLLEDIMMGLNILPNLERDSKKSHYLQPSQDGVPTVSQIPGQQNDAGHSRMHTAVSAAGCVFYQDLETQSYKSSTSTVLHSMSTSHFITPANLVEPDFSLSPQSKFPHCQPPFIQNLHSNTNHLGFVNSRWIDGGLPTCCTGIHCCFTAQNQPSCSTLSSVLLDDAVIQQQEGGSPQNHSSVRSMWQGDGMSHQSTPLSKSQECLHPEPPTRSVMPSAFLSAGQKLHYAVFQEPTPQDNQHILELLPLNNETQSIHSLCLPSMDDLRLPRCLSPLEPSTSSTKHQPDLKSPLNIGVKIQPSLHKRPWLTEDPGSLQFPLSAITQRDNKSVSSPKDTNCSCWSKQQQENLKLNPQNGETWAESCTDKEMETREAVSACEQNAAERKSDHRKMKEGDTTRDTIAPKRKKKKCTSHLQDAAGSLLAHKHVKVSDGTKSQINLSVCQVSLSSNNVLAKNREMATNSLNIASKLAGKPNQLTPVTGPGVNTGLTRIRTRGFLKKAQESSDTSPDTLFPITMARRDKIVNKQRVTSRKRGRPPKTQLEEFTYPNNNPVVVEKKNRNEESQQKMDNNLPKANLENGDKTKPRCKKRRINRSTEVGVISLKKTAGIESNGKPDADIEIIPDIRKPGTPKRPQMVTLKEFKNLIKRQHSKIRKSKESQETNETVRDAENEGMASRDGRCKESTKAIKMDIDITQPQAGSGSDESQVIVSVRDDKNHNQISKELTDENNKSQRDDTGNSTCMETSLFSEAPPVFSFDVLEEEVAKLAAEREQPLTNPDEAGTTCDAGESNTTQQIAITDKGLSHSDTHQPQEIKLLSEHSSHPQTPLSDAGGIVRTSGWDEDEEEEEEVEVDVLLYSPLKVPQTRECDDGLNNMEITPDEEEEEDVNEIDVTGDEAE